MPRFHVNPPSPVASPYGLLSVVDARYDEASPHWRQGVEWDELCGTLNTTYDPCFTVTDAGSPPPTPPAKTSEMTFQDRGAQPFTVVARFDCSPAAWAEHAQELGEDALTRLESWQVERTFWTGMAAGQDVVFPHLAADAEVTDSSTGHPVLLQTAATPVTGVSLSLVEGLGLLEQALADCYGSAGVIHVPASLGAALAAERLIERDGRRLRTLNGNLVALGGGYPGTGPDGSTPAPGHVWIYATGNVFAYRSRVEVPPLPSIVNRANNTASAIAERTYVLGWDCCHFAVQVEVSEIGGGGVDSSDIQATEPLAWDANTNTMSMEGGTDGQYLATDGGAPTWETPGQPGTLPGPLDGSGHIPAGQLPPTPLHETFEAASEAEMLAAPVSAPAVCIRTDFSPPHLFYLHTDPASDIGNWTDLGAGISTGADPTAQVGTAVVNGVAATYMRSDAAPPINQAMSPTWTGHHTFGGQVTIPNGAAVGRVATSDGSGNLTWQALDKSDVGLGNVDNTSDANKPISTATQTALNAKFTTPTPLIPKVVFGTTLETNVAGLVGYDQDPTGDSLAMRTLDGQVTTATPTANNHAANKAYVDTVAAAAGASQAWGTITGTLSAQADLQAALDAKATAAALTTHTGNTANPHAVTKAQVGLSDVDNTADAAKPVSTAVATALAGKVATTDKASQPQAEAGTDDAAWMTPLKVSQAIAAQVHGGPTQDVDTYVLTTDQPISSTSPAGLSDFSHIHLVDDKTQVRLIEGTFYISGAHEAGIRWWFTNSNIETITFNGSAVIPASAGDQMVFADYNPVVGPNQGFEADPGDAQIRAVTFGLYVTSTPTGGSYGNLGFAAAQQTSFGSPVIIHAGSKITSRLLSST